MNLAVGAISQHWLQQEVGIRVERREIGCPKSVTETVGILIQETGWLKWLFGTPVSDRKTKTRISWKVVDDLLP